MRYKARKTRSGGEVIYMKIKKEAKSENGRTKRKQVIV
jgi:hypothetical protein